MQALKCPFPAIGGKSRVASLVWSRLGDVDNYIEPFAFSAAVLLSRPTPPRVETINDLNCYVANFWRSTASEEGCLKVAEAADWPVNEADLVARHRYLVKSDAAAEFRDKVRQDPFYHDPLFAAWWAWGACCWIGSGWCHDVAPGRDVAQQIPKSDIGNGSTGVTNASVSKRPRLGSSSGDRRTHDGTGVHAKATTDHHRIQLGDAFSRGRGLHANDSAETCRARRAWLVDWFSRLRDRMRVVRVCCGDWTRVCSSPSVTTRLGLTGIFLDPPYSLKTQSGKKNRSKKLYANDATQDVDRLVRDVRQYCLERGQDPKIRIALCGLADEGHEVLERHGWTVESWTSSGYQNISQDGLLAAKRERIWFSPHCLGRDKPEFGAMSRWMQDEPAPPLADSQHRSPALRQCTCVGYCKGPEGLAPGWACVYADSRSVAPIEDES